MRSAQAQDFFLSSEITARKNAIVHPGCVIFILLALRTPSFSKAEAAGDVKRSARGVSVSTS